MIIEVQSIGIKAKIISLEGTLDVHTTPTLSEVLEKIFEKNEFNILLDLRKLDFISSYGLGTIANAYMKSEKSGGKLKLCCIADSLRMPFEVTGLLEKIDNYPTRDEAVSSF